MIGDVDKDLRFEDNDKDVGLEDKDKDYGSKTRTWTCDSRTRTKTFLEDNTVIDRTTSSVRFVKLQCIHVTTRTLNLRLFTPKLFYKLNVMDKFLIKLFVMGLGISNNKLWSKSVAVISMLKVKIGST